MKNILLLGAGYANISLLKHINRDFFKRAKWTIVSNTPYHYKTIALHDVATGKHNRSVLFPLQEVLDSEIQIVEDTIETIEAGRVNGRDRHYEYDYLFVGLGFSPDSFGIPGVAEYTHSITSYNSAISIYEKIIDALQRYLETKNNNDLSFVICGGGFTGIEFAGSLAQEVKKQCDSRGIDFNQVQIYCIEAMPRILPMFSETLMNAALVRLKDLGIAVLTNSKILECKIGSVVIEQNGQKNEIFANTIIWTAGVKGNNVIANSPFFKSGRSKVEVNEWLQPINQDMQNYSHMKNIFVLGDCAALKDPISQRFYPPTAQLATRMGKYMAETLEILLHSQEVTELDISNLPKFEFESQGSICSIGSGYAVGVVKQREIKGFVANALKWTIESQWNYELSGLSGIFKED